MFSFQANKIIGIGEGGAVVTSCNKYFYKIRNMHDQGCARQPDGKPYWDNNSYYGFNYKMNEVTGALRAAQIEKVDVILREINQKYKWFIESISVPIHMRIIPEEAEAIGVSVCFYVPAGVKKQIKDRLLKS